MSIMVHHLILIYLLVFKSKTNTPQLIYEQRKLIRAGRWSNECQTLIGLCKQRWYKVICCLNNCIAGQHWPLSKNWRLGAKLLEVIM